MEGVAHLRAILKLSRPELARFLGVSEATVVRWEAEDASVPRGLQAVLLQTLADAIRAVGAAEVTSIVRMAALDHRAALATLLKARSQRVGRRTR